MRGVYRALVAVLLFIPLGWIRAGTGGGSAALAAPSVIFTDGFESGNSWTYWSNGSNASQTLVNNPVHSGSWALQSTAGPDAGQPEIGLADIKSFSFTESNSQLSFWYFASGGATYKNITIEAYDAAGNHYFTTLPQAVVTGQWTQAKAMFTDLSPQLAGAQIAQFVIKPVITPTSGTAVFTLDDVSITNGVLPPPHLVATAPAAGATNVPLGRVLTAFFDTDLAPGSVTAGSVHLSGTDGAPVPAAVRYQAGQRAVAVIPAADLSPNTTYEARIDGVTSAAGTPLDSPVSWSFRTGPAGNQVETVLADDFASSAGWTWWSSAATSNQQLVANPTHGTAQALEATAGDPSVPFALSQIRAATWVDENSSLDFWYYLSGTAQLQDLVVMITTSGGQILWKTFDSGSLPANTWTEFHARLADISPNLVGLTVKQVEIKIETTGPGSLQYVLDNVRVTADLGQYAALPATTPLDPHHPLDPSTRDWVNGLAAQIMKSQYPDGSIVVGPGPGDVTRLIPYFSNYAAFGLLRVYQVTNDRRYLHAANAWLDWYQSHMRGDGSVDDYTGSYPNWTDTGARDSVDSYASTFMLAVWKAASLQRGPGAPGAGSSYVAGRYPYVARAYAALDSVYLSDGLTIALGSYPVEFIMDNAETWLGLVADQKLATLAGDAAQAKLSGYLAMRTMYALRNRFWMPDNGFYAYASFPDGSVQGSMQAWYPDGLSNVLFFAVVGQPTQADRSLYERLVVQFDQNDAANRPTAVDDTSQYMWWAMAGLRVGDPQAAAHFIQEYASVEGTHNPNTLASTAGELILALTYSWDGSLWF